MYSNSVTLLLFACAKEDEASEQSKQTFLEKYDGVGFEAKSYSGDVTEYWFFTKREQNFDHLVRFIHNEE